MKKDSYTLKVYKLFLANPNKYISADRLAKVGGKYAWRTRTSEVRKAPYCLFIVNRQRQAKAGHTISEYVYHPVDSSLK